MDPKVRLFLIEGSQFCGKALAALDSRNVPYERVHVSVLSKSSREKELPAPGSKVPQMTFRTPGGETGLAEDSFALIRRIDEMLEGSKSVHSVDEQGRNGFEPLLATDEIVAAEKHICREVNALVLYFNHVSEDGWIRSIRAKAKSQIPPLIRNIVPYSFLLSGTRREFAEEVKRTLSVDEKDMNDDYMRNRLIAELERYELKLKANKGPLEGAHGAQGCSFIYGTELPSAADVSLYAMVCRFVGNMGDADLPPCLPDLFSQAEGKLDAVAAWYTFMEKEYPFKFK